MVARNFQELIDVVVSDPSQPITHEDVTRLAKAIGLTAFYNSAGLEVAQRFDNGSLSYAICDAIMNDLWNLALDDLDDLDAQQLPEPFYQIYEAFDAGEYHRRSNKAEDPVAEFTQPMITEILRKSHSR